MPLNPGVVSSSFSGAAFSSNLPGAYINIPNALSQTIQTVSGIRFAVHVLDNVGTNSVQVLTNVQVEYVVIAGGGSGGGGQSNVGGGGGGAGGYRYGTNLAVSAGTYNAIVGAGATSSSYFGGNRGGSSSIFGISCTGGGPGGWAGPGGFGGSGGGNSGSGYARQSPVSGEGNFGGVGTGRVGIDICGGGAGGGAGAQGLDSPTNNGSTGITAGVTVPISGFGYVVCRGGQGNAAFSGATGTAGTNYGDGGGGAGGLNGAGQTGGAGFKGLIIIRYPIDRI